MNAHKISPNITYTEPQMIPSPLSSSQHSSQQSSQQSSPNSGTSSLVKSPHSSSPNSPSSLSDKQSPASSDTPRSELYLTPEYNGSPKISPRSGSQSDQVSPRTLSPKLSPRLMLVHSPSADQLASSRSSTSLSPRRHAPTQKLKSRSKHTSEPRIQSRTAFLLDDVQRPTLSNSSPPQTTTPITSPFLRSSSEPAQPSPTTQRRILELRNLKERIADFNPPSLDQQQISQPQIQLQTQAQIQTQQPPTQQDSTTASDEAPPTSGGRGPISQGRERLTQSVRDRKDIQKAAIKRAEFLKQLLAKGQTAEITELSEESPEKINSPTSQEILNRISPTSSNDALLNISTKRRSSKLKQLLVQASAESEDSEHDDPLDIETKFGGESSKNSPRDGKQNVTIESPRVAIAGSPRTSSPRTSSPRTSSPRNAKEINRSIHIMQLLSLADMKPDQEKSPLRDSVKSTRGKSLSIDKIELDSNSPQLPAVIIPPKRSASSTNPLKKAKSSSVPQLSPRSSPKTSPRNSTTTSTQTTKEPSPRQDTKKASNSSSVSSEELNLNSPSTIPKSSSHSVKKFRRRSVGTMTPTSISPSSSPSTSPRDQTAPQLLSPKSTRRSSVSPRKPSERSQLSSTSSLPLLLPKQLSPDPNSSTSVPRDLIATTREDLSPRKRQSSSSSSSPPPSPHKPTRSRSTSISRREAYASSSPLPFINGAPLVRRSRSNSPSCSTNSSSLSGNSLSHSARQMESDHSSPISPKSFSPTLERRRSGSVTSTSSKPLLIPKPTMHSLSTLYPQIEEQTASCESETETTASSNNNTKFKPRSISPEDSILEQEKKNRSKSQSLTILKKSLSSSNKPTTTEPLPLSQMPPQEELKKSPKLHKQISDIQQPTVSTPGRVRGRSSSYSAKQLLEQGREIFGRKRSNSSELDKSLIPSSTPPKENTQIALEDTRLKTEYLSVETFSPLISDEVRNWIIYCERKSLLCERKLIMV